MAATIKMVDRSMYPCVTSIDQKWQEIGDDSTWKQFKNLSTGRCLSATRLDGSSVVQATISNCLDSPSQLWRRSRNTGEFTIVNQELGGCLLVNHRNDGGGATVGGCPVTPPAMWRKMQTQGQSEALATLLADHVSIDVDNYELSLFTSMARE